MIKLESITKDYKVADTLVHALKGISVSFREAEFVSILGQSGCGKTTLLNIIGGLDHYTSGNLIIDNISTKDYKDRDWDTYRNHRVGFVFQSYNLIPHQTVLENVELALNIAGIKKEERITRAKKALDRVGLSEQYNKKPNQLSGGQCQRVAIARALVNDPEILLADEPTGALDSETSVQIMELIKEISNETLVIMVTHNPELAEKYSTRIIKLLDGNIIADTNEFNPEIENSIAEEKVEETENLSVKENDENNETNNENGESNAEENVIKEGLDESISNNTTSEEPKNTAKKQKTKKSKLGFWSAFKLSARNLWSKFKRTLMVCFAGSIGIIGVASVLAVSTGITAYIDNMQNDMLSGNPVTIQETTININYLMGMNPSSQKEAIKQSVIDGYVNVDKVVDALVEMSGQVENLQVQNDINEDYINFLLNMPKEYYEALKLDYGFEISNNIYTSSPFIGDENKNISLKAIKEIYTSILKQTELKDYASLVTSLENTFLLLPDNKDFILSQYDILKENGDHTYPTKTNEITLVVNKDTEISDLFLAQLGYYTQEEFVNTVYKATEHENHNPNLDKERFSYEDLLGKTFTWYPNDVVYNKTDTSSPLAMVNPFSYNPYVTDEFENGIELTITTILRPKEDLSYGCLGTGLYYTDSFSKMVVKNSLTSEIVKHLVDNEQESYTSGEFTSEMGVSKIGIMYKYSFEFEGNTYSDNTGFIGSQNSIAALMGSQAGMNIPNYYSLTLRELGGCSMPYMISIYSSEFDKKDLMTAYLDKWNSNETITITYEEFDTNGDVIIKEKTLTKEDRVEIQYTDTLSLIISMISGMISMVTTALVAFTALSLVVSTVMISIITYVSVIERVKEIGVIRSLGGRKKDVSRLFIAESGIIGFTSGVIGILVTAVISLVINIIADMTIATLTIPIIISMITISTLLTLISGLIPANIASKKDPVVALRTE